MVVCPSELFFVLEKGKKLDVFPVVCYTSLVEAVVIGKKLSEQHNKDFVIKSFIFVLDCYISGRMVE